MSRSTAVAVLAGLLLASCTISTVSSSSEPPVRRSVASLTSTVPSLNAFRSQNGLNTLSQSPRLQAVAEAQAQHIKNTGELSHRGPRGGNIGDRAKQQGYGYCTVAENLAMGEMTRSQVITSWSESPRHRENMLKRQVREYGLAALDNRYWVLVVGRNC
ncbi:CAP domain-containing protein [Roseivivax halodurans]|uniref:CAP domain-containing protein n=1 Tax=Roseivivax halodurans TaxID=93683 RepID=UPI0009FBB8C3